MIRRACAWLVVIGLLAAQRAGYCACLELPGVARIMSISPELFFRWADGSLELRPMKGTRPRGRWSGEDRARAEELHRSSKDRAENLMIVDLMRNDLARVAEAGSVRLDGFAVRPVHATQGQGAQ